MTPRSTLLAQSARPLYWIMLAAALWILLRGHNEPGGGFIGGLVAVAGSSLLAITLGTRVARRWQPFAPLPLTMIGVGLALLAGLVGATAGLPFLTHLWTDIGLSTVTLFDLGVFFAVWGALTGFIYALLADPDTEEAP
ncbi:MAG: MnhB domain-containing protein [Thiobacillaceae bacterium]|jgi:multicomponent Na+:H+ antiporter subunit B